MNTQEPLDIYSLIQPLVQKDIADAIKKEELASQYKVVKIPAHTHDGISGTKINFSDLNTIPITAVVPTYKPINGTMVVYDDKVSVRKLYIFISGVWYSTLLT